MKMKLKICTSSRLAVGDTDGDSQGRRHRQTAIASGANTLEKLLSKVVGGTCIMYMYYVHVFEFEYSFGTHALMHILHKVPW